MPQLFLISSTVNLYDSGQNAVETTMNEFLNERLIGNENFNNSSLIDALTSNDTNSTDKDYVPYDMRIETYLIPFIFSIIFFLGDYSLSFL